MDFIEERFCEMLVEERDVRSRANNALLKFANFVGLAITINVIGGVGVVLKSTFHGTDLTGMIVTWMILVLFGALVFDFHTWRCITKLQISVDYVNAKIERLQVEMKRLVGNQPIASIAATLTQYASYQAASLHQLLASLCSPCRLLLINQLRSCLASDQQFQYPSTSQAPPALSPTS